MKRLKPFGWVQATFVTLTGKQRSVTATVRNESEQFVISLAQRMREAGMTNGEIARRLNAVLLKHRGKRWTATLVSAVLKRGSGEWF